MSPAAASPIPPVQQIPRLFGWQRLRVILIVCAVLSAMMAPTWQASYLALVGRWLFIGSACLLMFGLFERWPSRLPGWIARWTLQVAGVVVVIPFAAWFAYVLTTQGDPVPFWRNNDRLAGFGMFTVTSLLIAPWMAVAALIGQINGKAQRQALAFELERSEFERKAVDAHLRLLQAQVEPHFLFNTLANIRELVDSGSPRASAVLGSLIAYLRAAVPRLQEPATTLRQELDLVQAYLDVMHMRMPDRLQFELHVDTIATSIPFPPMALLTLVENAVRHGIDPSESGGRIEIRIVEDEGRCRVQVIDSGVGLARGSGSPGTGLSTLRERLQIVYGGDAHVWLIPLTPNGACAELEFPLQRRSS